VVGFAAGFYRELLRAQCGTALSADRELQGHVHQAIERGASDTEAAARRLDRCLDAAGQIDRNANQATLVECWMDDLAR
jgi:hypothetical protein